MSGVLKCSWTGLEACNQLTNALLTNAPLRQHPLMSKVHALPPAPHRLLLLAGEEQHAEPVPVDTGTPAAAPHSSSSTNGAQQPGA